MGNDSIMKQLILENRGYLFTAHAAEKGVSNQEVISYVKSNKMERVAHGIYVTPDTWEDNLFILQSKNHIAIFSHESALMLHGLAEREFEPNVTVPMGYNGSHLRKKGVKVHTVVKDYYNIGIIKRTTVFGNTVNVYNRERTICDIIRNKNNMDIQVFSYAIREYMRGSDKNLPLLSEYGKIFGISKKIHTYTEVMLV